VRFAFLPAVTKTSSHSTKTFAIPRIIFPVSAARAQAIRSILRVLRFFAGSDKNILALKQNLRDTPHLSVEFRMRFEFDITRIHFVNFTP